MSLGAGIALIAGMAAAAAPDPWGLPRHLRVIAERPEDISDRDSPRVRLRLWWDGGPATVQLSTPRGWRTIAEGASPGLITAPLPAHARLRVRLDGGARWSAPVALGPWQTPDHLAVALGVGGGDVVGEIAVDGPRLWVGTVGGGAWTRAGPAAPWRRLGAWEGLPDARALGVSAAGGGAAVGTAAGVALFEEDRLVRLLDEQDGLPDRWVQAVRHSGDGLWIGTYRGLVRLSADGLSPPILSPWSVFSIAAAPGGGAWVGYEGVVRVEPDGRSSPWLEQGPAFALRPDGDGALAALPAGGVQRLAAPQQATPLEGPAGAWGLEATPGGLWIAAGPEGLWGPGGRRIGRGAGLPADGVRAVAADPGGGLWVGTDAGLAWVSSAGAPVGRAVHPGAPVALDARALLVDARGLWVAAGAGGLRAEGEVRRGAENLVAGSDGDAHALAGDAEGGLWALGDRLLRLGRRGRLQAWHLPGEADQLAVFGAQAWVGGSGGLWRVEAGGLTPIPGLRGVRDLHADALGLWVAAPHAIFRVVGSGSMAYVRSHPPLALASADGGLWVGTEDGLERLWIGGDDPGRVDDVLGERDAGVAVPVLAADGRGGCWFAGADGSVGHVDAAGRAWTERLPLADPPRVQALAPDGRQGVWVGTDAGVYRLRRAAGQSVDQPPPTTVL